MKLTDLPHPGAIPSAKKLQRTVANALSELQVADNNTGVRRQAAIALEAFFDAAKAKATALKPGV